MWPFKQKENRSDGNPENPATPLSAIFSEGAESNTGVTVTPDTAMRSAAVYACVNLVSGTIASLALHTYKRLTPDGKEKAYDHPLYKLFHESPNPEQTSFEFFQLMQAFVMLRGNAYAEKVYNRAGYVTELWPIIPTRVAVERDRVSQELVYRISLPNGGTVNWGREKIYHFKGLGGDGVIGYSPVRLGREAIGLSLATEEFGARFFSNGASPSFVLKHPGKLSATAHTNIRKSFDGKYTGLSKAHRVKIIEEGMDYAQMGLSQEDSQYLETRLFQARDICTLFNVPPVMIGLETGSGSYANASAEQLSLNFVTHCVRPWLVSWEQSIKKHIFDENDNEHFAQFLVDSLTRGDIVSRYNAYNVGRNSGFLSANDIRAFENMNPLPDKQGDIYLIPLNMVPAGAAGAAGKAGDLAKQGKTPAVPAKRQMKSAFERLFRDAAMRVVKRERADVLRQARKQSTGGNSEEFTKWLDGFYEEHRDFVVKNLSPVITSICEVSGSESSVLDVDDYASRHIAESKQEILGLIKQGESGIEGRLSAMFDSWETKRTADVAAEEVSLNA